MQMKKMLILLILMMVPSVVWAGGAIEVGATATHTAVTYHVGAEYNRAGATVKGAYNYGKHGTDVLTDNARLSLGYDALLRGNWGAWFDYTVGNDRPAGIEVEHMVGAGPKYTPCKWASLSFGYLAHKQVMADGVRTNLERWSWRLRVTHSGAGFISMYQPAVNNSADYILNNRAWYDIGITNTLIMKLSVDSEYRAGWEHRLMRRMTLAYKF